MARKRNRHGRRHNSRRRSGVSIGEGLVAVGTIGSSVGIVISAIVMLVFIGVGVYLIYEGAKGSVGGGCHWNIDNNLHSPNCPMFNKESCISTPSCQWSGDATLSGEGRTWYIVGGVICILMGIGIFILSIWWNKVVRRNKNLAAIAGGFTLFDAAVGVIKN